MNNFPYCLEEDDDCPYFVEVESKICWNDLPKGQRALCLNIENKGQCPLKPQRCPHCGQIMEG